MVAPVRPGDDLAIRGEHPRRREGPVGAEGVLALADELAIGSSRANGLLELFKPQVEDVVRLAENARIDQAPGLFQQSQPIDEIAADDAVLRILAIPDERPDTIDHPLGLLRLALTVWQGSQSLAQLLLLGPRLLPAPFEVPLGGAGVEVPDVGED